MLQPYTFNVWKKVKCFCKISASIFNALSIHAWLIIATVARKNDMFTLLAANSVSAGQCNKKSRVLF